MRVQSTGRNRKIPVSSRTEGHRGPPRPGSRLGSQPCFEVALAVGVQLLIFFLVTTVKFDIFWIFSELSIRETNAEKSFVFGM